MQTMDNPAHLETQEPGLRSNRPRWKAGALVILVIVTAGVAYAGYYLRSSCEVNAVEKASTLLVTQLKRYDQIYQVATSAPRTSIVRPVTMMQLILMDTQEMSVPACLQTAKDELVQYMGTVIRAFLAFGAQEADAAIKDLVDQSDAHYDNFTKELDAVNECAPYCIR